MSLSWRNRRSAGGAGTCWKTGDGRFAQSVQRRIVGVTDASPSSLSTISSDRRTSPAGGRGTAVNAITSTSGDQRLLRQGRNTSTATTCGENSGFQKRKLIDLRPRRIAIAAGLRRTSFGSMWITTTSRAKSGARFVVCATTQLAISKKKISWRPSGHTSCATHSLSGGA